MSVMQCCPQPGCARSCNAGPTGAGCQGSEVLDALYWPTPKLCEQRMNLAQSPWKVHHSHHLLGTHAHPSGVQTFDHCTEELVEYGHTGSKRGLCGSSSGYCRPLAQSDETPQ